MGDLQYIQGIKGTQFQRTNVSPKNKETICTNAWQPSLVLVGLGRARTVNRENKKSSQMD